MLNKVINYAINDNNNNNIPSKKNNNEILNFQTPKINKTISKK
jgi:hypothetical protein